MILSALASDDDNSDLTSIVPFSLFDYLICVKDIRESS